MSILEQIKSEDFVVSLGPELPAKAMRKVLLKTTEYASVLDALCSGIITDNILQTFANDLLSEFKKGERFKFDMTLALLAVCIERRMTSFADEYLRDLAALHILELPLSTRVARECLVKHNLLPQNERRDFTCTRFSPLETNNLIKIYRVNTIDKEQSFEDVA